MSIIPTCSINIPQPKTISELFTPDKISRYSSYTNTVIGDIFINYIQDMDITIADLINTKVAEKVYDRVRILMKNLIYAHLTDFKDASKLDLPMGFETKSDALSADTLEELKTIVRNFNTFKKFHIQDSSIFKLNKKAFNEDSLIPSEEEFVVPPIEDTNETSTDGITEEVGEKSAQFDKTSNDEDSYDTLEKEIRAMFTLLTKKKYDDETGKYEIVKDANGLPLHALSNSTYTLLISKVNDVKDDLVLINSLREEGLKRIIPELEQINKILKTDNILYDILKRNNISEEEIKSIYKLDIKNPTLSESQKQLWVNFSNNFSKPAIPVESLYNQNESIKDSPFFIKINDIKGNTEKIKQQWIYNFDLKNVSEDIKELLDTDVTGKVIYTKRSILPFPDTISKAMPFLESLGIKISLNNITDNERDYVYKRIVDASSKIHKTVSDLILKGVKEGEDANFINNPIEEIKKGNLALKIYGQSATLQELINIESKYSTLVPSMSVKNAIGELQYLINNESNISLGVHYLKNTQTLNELLQSPPFSNLKYNPQFTRSRIIQFLFDETGNRRTNNYIDLALQSGIKTRDNKNKITRKFTKRDKLINDFNSMLLYGKTDVMRLSTSHSFYTIGLKSKSTQEFSRDEEQLYFSIDKFIGEKSLNNNLVSGQFLGYLNGEIERIKSYEDKLKNEPSLKNYEFNEFSIFNNLTKELAEKLKTSEEPITKEHPLYSEFISQMNERFDKELKDFDKELDNNAISQEQLISESLLTKYPSKIEDEYETIEIDNIKMMKKAFLINNLIQNIEFGILFSGDSIFYNGDMHKRLQGLSSTGKYVNMNPLATSLVEQSEYTNSYSYKNLFGKKNNIVFKDKKVGHIYSQVLEDKLITEYYGKKLDDVGKVTDGQGWSNPDFLHELSLRQGWSNEYTELVFKRESLIMKRDILNIPLSGMEKNILDSFEDKIKKNPELYTIPPLKAGFFGPMLNTNIDAKVYDKFSLAPLFPSFIKNQPKLKQLLLDMVEGQYDYVKYNSATKGFKKTPIKTENLSKVNPNVLSKGMFKLQIATSNVAKETTSIPTQLLKLIFSNQFDNGKTSNNNIKKLYDEYLSTLSDIQVEKIDKLFISLGVNPKNTSEIDYKKLSEKLIAEAKERGMNDNIINSLGYNPATNYFNLHPEIGFLTEYEKLLTSIIDKTLRRYKVNGGDFVLITNGESIKLNTYINKKSKTVKSDCRITLTKEFGKLLNQIHPDGEKIGTLERVNDLIKDTKTGKQSQWSKDNEESLTAVLDRVPTQGLNSMDAVIVKEFIDPIMGNVVQLPDEIVVKAGLDFDYDKEKSLLPSFDDNGKLVKYKNQTRDELSNTIKSLKEKKNNLYNSYNLQLNNLSRSFLEVEDNKELDKIVQNIYIQEAEVNNILAEIKSLINTVNEDREPESYIEYVEKKTSGLINKIFSIDENSMKKEFYQFKNQLNGELLQKIEELNKEYHEKEALLIPILTSDKFNKYTKNSTNGKNLDAVQEFLQISEELQNQYSHKSNYFKNYSNNILRIYSEALIDPSRFEELISGNNTRNIRQIAKTIAELVNRKNYLPTGGDVYTYLDNLNVFDTFFLAKSQLGPYAKMNTIQQVLTYTGTKINKNIVDKYGKQFEISHLLLSPEETDKIEKENKILIGNNTDVKGNKIQEDNSESIDATVDAAKDPYYALLGINGKNIGVEILLTSIFKVPKELAITFLNHAGIRSYTDNLINGANKGEAKQAIIERLGLHQTDNTLYTEEVDLEEYVLRKSNKSYNIKRVSISEKDKTKRIIEYTQDKQIPLYGKKLAYSYDNLMKLIDANDIEYIKKLNLVSIIDNKKYPLHELLLTNKPSTLEEWQDVAKPKNDIARLKNDVTTSSDEMQKIIGVELKALAYFHNSEGVANIFRELSSYLSFDTKKVAGILDSNTRGKQRIAILQSNLISEEELTKLETVSPIAAFENSKTIDKVFKTFMPISTSAAPILYDLIQEYESAFSTKTSRGSRTLPISIENQFIYSIIYNFGKNAKNGFNLLTKVNELTPDKSDYVYKDIVSRLEELKNSDEYQDIIKKFPIFEDLVSNIYYREPSRYFRDVRTILNIQFLKNAQLTPTEESGIIFQFDQLFKNEIHPDEKINANVKKLVTDLFDLALAQSAMMKDRISFKEFVPIEYYKTDNENALTNYYKLSKGERENYILQFNELFKYNNPKSFPKLGKATWSVEAQAFVQEKNTNKSSDKIKFYDILKANNIQSSETITNPIIEEATTSENDSEPELTREEQIISLRGRISELEDIGFDQQDATNPYLYIINNMPKITTKSAERETGVKVGIGKDITYSFIDDVNGVSVEKAAERVSETEQAERLGITGDMARNEIIEILQNGKKFYTEKYLGSSELRGLKQELAYLQGELNEKSLILGAHILNKTAEEGVIIKIGKASVEVLNLNTGIKKTVKQKDLQYLDKTSIIVPFLGFTYLVSPDLKIRNVKTGQIVKLNEDATKAVIAKYIEELPNKKCN